MSYPKSLFTGSAASLLAMPSLTFSTHLTAGCKRTSTTGNTSSLPVTGPLPTSSTTLMTSTLFLNLMANLQRASTRSISMPSIPYWTGASPTLWSSLPGRGTNMSLSAGWWMLPGAMDHPPYISPIWVTLPTIISPCH